MDELFSFGRLVCAESEFEYAVTDDDSDCDRGRPTRSEDFEGSYGAS